MPVDPSISLGVTPAAPPANPLGAIGGYADLQDKLNQLMLFRQTFAARQKAGQILASAPDMETGLQGLMKDPLTAPFSGEIINQARQGMLAQVQLQGEQQKQATDGLGAIIKGMSVGVSSPNMVGPSIDATMKTLSQSAQTRDGPAVDSLKSALTDGLPSDPVAARAEFTKRMAALSLAGGVTPDVIRAQTGTMAPQVIQTTDPTGAVTSRVVGGPAAGGSADLGQGGAPGAAPAGGNPLAPGLPPGTISRGPSATSAEYLKARGTDMADYQGRLDTTVSMGSQIMQTVSEARDAMANFKPGGGADAFAKAAQLAQAMGADPKLVNRLGNGDLGASQEFNKLMVNTTMGQIKQQLPNGSRLAQNEFNAFTESNPNIDTDPKAIEKIFNFWTKLYNRSADEQGSFNDYLKKGGDISQWPATWQKLATQKGYINPQITSMAEPAAPTQYKSADAVLKAFEAKTLPWDQAKQILTSQFGYTMKGK